MCVMGVSFFFLSRFNNHANHSQQPATLVTGLLNAPRSNRSGDQYLIKYLRALSTKFSPLELKAFVFSHSLYFLPFN
jgi:hypothetical protein